MENVGRLRKIPGYKGRYLVSESGMVFTSDKYGVYALALQRQGRYVKLTSLDGRPHMVRVARLVLEAFLPAPEIIHKNGDPTDNRLANLMWGAPSVEEIDEPCTKEL